MGNRQDRKEWHGGSFDKAGNVDTIWIFLRDVDPTAEKLYRSDQCRYFFRSKFLH